MRKDNTQYIINLCRHLIGELKIKLSLPLTDSPSTLRFICQEKLMAKVKTWTPEKKGQVISYALCENQIGDSTIPPRLTPRYKTDPFLSEGAIPDRYLDGEDLLNALALTTLMATIWDILVYDDQQNTIRQSKKVA